jgi:hypothetical protein
VCLDAIVADTGVVAAPWRSAAPDEILAGPEGDPIPSRSFVAPPLNVLNPKRIPWTDGRTESPSSQRAAEPRNSVLIRTGKTVRRTSRRDRIGRSSRSERGNGTSRLVQRPDWAMFPVEPSRGSGAQRARVRPEPSSRPGAHRRQPGRAPSGWRAETLRGVLRAGAARRRRDSADARVSGCHPDRSCAGRAVARGRRV